MRSRNTDNSINQRAYLPVILKMIHKAKIGSIEIGGEQKFFRFEEKDDFRIAFALAFD